MRSLRELGFIERSGSGTKLAEEQIVLAGVSLPTSYVRFLAHTPPAGRMFGFKFRRGPSRDEWEGQVERFYDYGKDPRMLDRSLLKSDERILLPIASDAGGNEILLDLSAAGQPVVDHDYQTGELSIIAPTFDAFIDSLYDVE